ncbi:galactose-binding domain-containing protein [Virgisporangium aurantiacum]|uniref:Glycosyl hydrolase n=1 Tax=Virgisporangium aurantiacum TaxID=175570 RepID=A0A8J4E328_9ACTN|nr:discoidin domain-containing protein [Virgisporangium aurantiacum]GIJ59518.1 glycosyl hydrolase [Virgisporangium aurantiacum]
MRRRSLAGALAAITLAATALVATAAGTASAAGGPNLAAGRTAAASTVNGPYVAANLTDGNQGSYWESSGALPQWAQVDLGGEQTIDQIVLKLPGAWEARTQTLSVQGSTNGSSFATIVASAGRSFAPGGNNTVTINFTATAARYVRVQISANTGWAAAQLAELEVYGATSSSANLAQGKAFTASGSVSPYGPGNAGDGNQGSYWESTNNAFPQWIQVDLGSGVSVNRVVLKLPSTWEARTQTLSVQGSTDGSSFATLVASAGRAFDPGSGNTVTLAFGAATARYVRVHVTANTQWPAAQLSELEVYGPTQGDTQAPTAPGSLAYTQPATDQIRLSWTASSDNVGVTAYDIYANNVLRTSVAGTVLAFVDTQPANVTVTYYVKARDAAGNQSPNSNSVTRNGTGGDTQAPTAPGNLAYTEPAAGQIRLTWTASTDNVGVTAYDVYANGTLRGTTAGTSYTDTQPATVTVSYHVKARDAAGNQSADSNTVTRVGTGGGANLAVGKPITASSTVFTFVAANANDDNLTTYWEAAGGAYPNLLTVQLGANAAVTSVVVKLNPDPVWGTRTQNIEVLGRDQGSSTFTSLRAAADYTFNPASGNSVTIPVTASVADVRLRVNSNSGSSGGQVAELQVIGTPAPNPDLTVTALSASPASPVETDTISVTATVRNGGTASSGATNVNVYLGTTLAGTAAVGALAAGATATVTANIGTRNAGSYPLVAKVDEANTVIETNETNNSFTAGSPLVVRPVDSSDLVPVASWAPGTPAAGNTVTFTVAIRNQGTIASAGGAHGITLTLLDGNGGTVRTFTGTFTGAIAAGATSAGVNLGTWPAANGRYTVRTAIAVDGNELPVKQANNTASQSLFVGRGANLPYEMYEAEDAVRGGGAGLVGPNRTVGDLGGEASGRRAVTLNSTGAYVEFTLRASTNTLVTRFSIPDGTNTSLSIYVDGVFHKTIDLTSKYAWLYGNEATPNNSPGSGNPRHIYDEANVMLNGTVQAGSRIRLQKDAANTSQYAIDFINTEQVAPIANPDPARYAVPAGFAQQDVQNALDRVRMDTTGNLIGVYLPAGNYTAQQKFLVYQKGIRVTGAGPWYTRISAPATQENTDIGFDLQAGASGTTVSNLAVFGNYTWRQDGPGKVFDAKNLTDLTVENVWIEHFLCLFWGTNVDNSTIRNTRSRDTFADIVNLTNGSTGNLVTNNESRSSGDDSFALFSATDLNSGEIFGNTFENLTSTLTWRAAGIAVYGGYNNVFRNIYVADTLVYSGITISSLDFGYPMHGFGASPPTRFENISIVRAGGHFWGAQTFPAIWVFSASKVFQGIRVSDVDIVDPTYHGIMFQTDYNPGPLFPVADTVFTNISITGAQRSGDAYDAKSGFGIWANELPEPGEGPVRGSVTFNNLRMSNNFRDVQNLTPSTFTITINP